jgi:hypothetical protein
MMAVAAVVTMAPVVAVAAAMAVAAAIIAPAAIMAAATTMFSLMTVTLVVATASLAMFTRRTVLVETGAASGASSAVTAGQRQRASRAQREKSNCNQRCHP